MNVLNIFELKKYNIILYNKIKKNFKALYYRIIKNKAL